MANETPSSARQAIRETAEAQEAKLRAFLEDALDATKELHVRCAKCQRSTPVTVPDWSARVRAVDLLLDQGYGPQRASSEHEGETLIVVHRVWPWQEDELDILDDEERELVLRAEELHMRASRAQMERQVRQQTSGRRGIDDVLPADGSREHEER